MDPPEQRALLENLRRRRVEKLAADERFIKQLLACVGAGYPLAELGRVIGISRQSVSSLVKRRVKA